ncbi:GNAT family N-acetyltransferase [Streptomyces sp. NPDC049555]|uniref:GNAT family N-acetyltransferase n=1 Tax=Streptomyces sp. NPDC049555 TaxID=3154930 RepID=UPI003436175E
MTSAAAPLWAIAPQPADSPEAAALLREYLTDVADRWHLREDGRPCTPQEIAGYLAETTDDDITPPRGVLLVGRDGGGEPGGCVGVRRLDARTAELTRMFVRPGHRGRGGAPALLAAAEAAARAWGAGRMVLETRRDLTEARALYARHGYVAIAPYCEGPYAEVWLGKDLG